MSALATQLNFGMRISATDATGGAFRSALQGLSSFARTAIKPITIPFKIAQGGLGFLRDINLGLAPVVRGLDHLIERGSGLEVVRKSFESLTGRSGKDTDKLARSIVAASSGTLRLAEAMQIANRAIGSGLSLEQLGTAIEFISKKAITTGKNANEALNTVITGLARGSTLFLDDFGILVDGVDGVRASFNKIKGAGAFDSLGPAAQKAETIRQAIAEMQQQMGKIGVTGGETVFQWAGIKNQVGDVVDKLFLAVTGSKAMREAMLGLRDILGGVSEHFRAGGGFMELLTGKGKSGGLMGLLGGGLTDIGSAFGRGVTGSLLIGASAVGETFIAAWDNIKSDFDLIWIGLKTIAEDAWVGLKHVLSEAWDELISKLKGAFSGGAVFGPNLGAPLLIRPSRPDVPGGGPVSGAFGLSPNPALAAAQAASLAAIGQSGGPSIWKTLAGAGNELLSGGVFGGKSAFGKQLAGFKSEFSRHMPDDPDDQVLLTGSPAPFRLTLSERIKRRRAIGVQQARLRNIAGGGEFGRQDARRLAGEDIRGLIRGGRHLSSNDREEIFQARLREQIERRARPIRARIDDRGDELNRAGNANPAARRANGGRDEAERNKKADELIAAIQQLVGALMGDARGFAAIAAGRG